MSKADNFLSECKKNLGKWTCSLHTTGSNQPASVFREVKKQGYEFEKSTSGSWGRRMYCPVCNQKTTHYRLLKLEPTLTKQVRLGIDKRTRARILNLFDNRDAFTGGSISSVAEIDHKVPWTRLDEDIDATVLSNAEIRRHFQLLTREHNLLKDRACSHCKIYNERPPFLEIPYWYKGDSHYCGDCEGCGWYDEEKWRKSLSELVNGHKQK